MLKPRVTGAGALVAAFALTACSTSAHNASTLSAPCARSEADVRQDALFVAPLSGVTTSRDLAAAAKLMGAMGQVITAAMQARSQHGPSATFFESELRGGSAPPLPPLLSGDVRRLTADMFATWAAVAAYGNSRASPGSIGDAAQRAMRDIQTIRAACAAAPR